MGITAQYRAIFVSFLSLFMVLTMARNGVGAESKSRSSGYELAGGEISVDESGRVTVGPKGAELQLEHGARLEAAPGTRFSLGRIFKLSLGVGANSRVPTRVLSIYEGALEIFVPKTQPIGFAVLIAGPKKAQAINRGGRSSVKVTKNGLIWAAHENNLLFGNGGAWLRVQEGNLRAITQYRPLGSSSTLPRAVQNFRSSGHLLRKGLGQSVQVHLHWDAVSAASRYEILVRNSQNKLVSRTWVDATEVDLRDLPVGAHSVRVRGVHSYGVGGDWSEAINLHVVGLSVAGVAVGSDAVVRLLSKQRVTLEGAEGLEVAYVGVDAYLPAPASLGLVARRPISLELRDPLSGERLSLRLEPLTVAARIRIARAPSSWPRLGLPVEIALIDAGGVPVSAPYRIKIVATANLEPLESTWQRESGSVRTRLAKPSGPGPWVIRVEVLDQTGRGLGRDVRDVGYASRGQRTATK